MAVAVVVAVLGDVAIGALLVARLEPRCWAALLRTCSVLRSLMLSESPLDRENDDDRVSAPRTGLSVRRRRAGMARDVEGEWGRG